MSSITSVLQEAHFLMGAFSFHVYVDIFHEKPSFIKGSIYIPYSSQLHEIFGTQSHPFHELWVYKVVGSSRINQSFLVCHGVTGAK
jgi:hypothetical protein